MKKFLNRTLLTGALLVPLTLGAQTQTPGDAGTNYESRHEQWKAMRQQLKAEIEAEDQELQQLATQMNNAPADQKPDAIAAVVNKLVEDRLAMHQRFEAMHQQMQGTNGPSSGETNTSPSP